MPLHPGSAHGKALTLLNAVKADDLHSTVKLLETIHDYAERKQLIAQRYKYGNHKITLLHVAAGQRNNPEMVRTLRQLFPGPAAEFETLLNTRGKPDDRTALHDAVLNNCTGCVQLLLSMRADVNSTALFDSNGIKYAMTALHIAAATSSNHLIVQQLLDSQADVTARAHGQNKECEGYPALFFLPDSLESRTDRSPAESAKIAKALLVAKADVNPGQCSGNVLMWLVAQPNNEQIGPIARVLMEGRADPNQKADLECMYVGGNENQIKVRQPTALRVAEAYVKLGYSAVARIVEILKTPIETSESSFDFDLDVPLADLEVRVPLSASASTGMEVHFSAAEVESLQMLIPSAQPSIGASHDFKSNTCYAGRSAQRVVGKLAAVARSIRSAGTWAHGVQLSKKRSCGILTAAEKCRLCEQIADWHLLGISMIWILKLESLAHQTNGNPCEDSSGHLLLVDLRSARWLGRMLAI